MIFATSDYIECEMSSVHGLLSQIPQDLPFEKLLVDSQLLYEQIPPHTIKVNYNLISQIFLLSFSEASIFAETEESEDVDGVKSFSSNFGIMDLLL